MPNWVKNKIIVKKGDFSKYIEGDSFDFEKIIPYPTSPVGLEERFLGTKNLQVIDGKDWFNWYTWCVEKWGTKWNACEFMQEEENILSFETAWSFPEPIFEEIAKSNPDWEFEVRFADECYGCNTGYAIYKNGKMHKGYIYKDGSVAAEKNSEDVWAIG